jgi:hypothetical protein
MKPPGPIGTRAPALALLHEPFRFTTHAPSAGQSPVRHQAQHKTAGVIGHYVGEVLLFRIVREVLKTGAGPGCSSHWYLPSGSRPSATTWRSPV